jgi:hypothetical protein
VGKREIHHRGRREEEEDEDFTTEDTESTERKTEERDEEERTGRELACSPFLGPMIMQIIGSFVQRPSAPSALLR